MQGDFFVRGDMVYIFYNWFFNRIEIHANSCVSIQGMAEHPLCDQSVDAPAHRNLIDQKNR